MVSTALTVFLWTGAVLIGLPLLLIGLSLFIVNWGAKGIEVARTDDEIPVPVTEVPNVPAKQLIKRAEAVKALGFTELIGSTRPAFTRDGMANYSWIFVSPDKKTLAEVEYIRFSWMLRIMTLIFSPRDFHFSMIATVFTTAIDDHERLMTADFERLATPEERAKGMIQVVPRETPLGERYALHRRYIEGFAAEHGSEVLAFSSTDDYLRYSRIRMKRTTDKAEAELAAATGRCLD